MFKEADMLQSVRISVQWEFSQDVLNMSTHAGSHDGLRQPRHREYAKTNP